MNVCIFILGCDIEITRFITLRWCSAGRLERMEVKLLNSTSEVATNSTYIIPEPPRSVYPKENNKERLLYCLQPREKFRKTTILSMRRRHNNICPFIGTYEGL